MSKSQIIGFNRIQMDPNASKCYQRIWFEPSSLIGEWVMLLIGHRKLTTSLDVIRTLVDIGSSATMSRRSEVQCERVCKLLTLHLFDVTTILARYRILCTVYCVCVYSIQSKHTHTQAAQTTCNLQCLSMRHSQQKSIISRLCSIQLG